MNDRAAILEPVEGATDVTANIASYGPDPESGFTDGVIIGVDAVVGNVESRKGVWIRDRGKVYGELRTGQTVTLQNQTYVAGTVFENFPYLNLGDINVMEEFNDGGTPVTLEPDEVMPLDPGVYGDVNIKPRAELYLSNGSYYFTSYSSEPQSELHLDTLDGPILIYVRNGCTFKGDAIEDAAQHHANVRFVCMASSGATVTARFLGTLVAPNGWIIVDAPWPPTAFPGFPAQLGHHGAFYGYGVLVHQDQLVWHYPLQYWLP